MVLKSRVKAPDWSADGNTEKEAKCRKHPLPKDNVCNAETDPWFYAEEEAARVCNGDDDQRVCPFRQACLYGALVNNEQSGVFGGLTTRQRRWIRKQRKGDPEGALGLTDEPIWEDQWADSDEWRHKVPTTEELKEMEDEEIDDEEEDTEEY